MGPLGGTLRRVTEGANSKEAPSSCCTLNWISVVGDRTLACSTRPVIASRPGTLGLRWAGRFARGVDRCYGPVVVRAAIESMNGARFVLDTLESCGWGRQGLADAQKVTG